MNPNASAPVLPEAWPGALPLPAGVSLLSSQRDAEVLRARFVAPPCVALRSFFVRRLDRDGWSIVGVSAAVDGPLVLEFEGHQVCGQVEVGATSTFVIQVVT